MKTLSEMLCERSGRDLFLMACTKKVSLPGEWTDAEKSEIMRTCYNDTDNEKYYLWFLENWENGEFEPVGNDPEDAESKETVKRQQEWRDRCLRIGRRLRSINENKKDYTDILAKELLRPENIRSMLLDLRDPCIQTIRDICASTLKEENGFYPMACNPDKNWHYLILETLGYALIRKTDPCDEPDDRTHCTGLCIPDDVLSLIKKADTAELEAKRSIRRFLDSLELIVQDYYDAAPIDIVHQIYSNLRAENPDRYPDFSEEELDRAITEYSQGNPGLLYGMLTFRGKRYMYNTSEEEITDDTKAEYNYLVSIIENWEERDVDPYIPPLAEMQNYLEYGYWEARKPFRDLHQFVVEYYMDEQTMSEMGGGIMMMAMDPEERDEYRRKHHYSMDTVLENTSEEFSILRFDLSGGIEPGEIYRGRKEFTCTLSDSAKRKYRRLLTKCAECVPLAWRLGNTADHRST